MKASSSVKRKSFLDSDNAINLMYLPALILFLVFVIFPFISGIKISFTNWNGYSQNYKYIGFKNYLRIFKNKDVLSAFINTCIYGIGSTTIQQVLGLGLAVFLNREFKGRTAVRTIIYLPVMISGLIMGYICYFIVQYDGGALNDILGFLGKQPIDWMLKDGASVWIITLINSLQFVGVSMVIYLAGLQSIPQMYYEAADIDGASKWTQFKNITIPLLMPAIISSVTINLIGGLKLFDVIVALTGGARGGTHSFSTFINYSYFRTQDAGFASALGIVLFIFILFISLVVLGRLQKKVVDC